MRDISRCGKDNIFHNARKIKSLMEKNGMTRGHMNYDDPPTFYSGSVWEKEGHERKKTYKDDLYKFIDEEIMVAELTGSEPIRHIYKNSFFSGDNDEKEEDKDTRGAI